MKYIRLLVLVASLSSFAQMAYEPKPEFPYGRPNPEAPIEIKDFEGLIGSCNCMSQSRKPDGSWSEAIAMVWKWKYIMNGMAVQDETLKSDGNHSGSIRQFNTEKSKWYVHYYASNQAVDRLPTWEGTKKDDGTIVLYRNQPSPQGTPGFYRLTFYDINDMGYNWVGEWVDTTETTVYPTWKISCSRKH